MRILWALGMGSRPFESLETIRGQMGDGTEPHRDLLD
jgi:hypothetical protein